METNCRKLVSACVQLGKSSLLLPGSLERRQLSSWESGEKSPPAPQRAPLPRTPPRATGTFSGVGGGRRKGNQTSRAVALSSWRGLSSRRGLLAKTALTLLQAARRVAQGQMTALTGLPRGRRAGRAVRPSSNRLFALCPSFSSVPARPLTLARGSFPPPFGIRCHRTRGGRTKRPRRAAGGR